MTQGKDAGDLSHGLARALTRVELSEPTDLKRLTGGATMESWRFSAHGEDFVLRRAPSPEMMAHRALDHRAEAAIIRAVRSEGVTAPEIVVELEPADGIGTGFVMRAMPGTPDPTRILDCKEPDSLLEQCARELVGIHRLSADKLPASIPAMDYRDALTSLEAQFEETGGDRPIIALALRWLSEHLPEPVPPRLVHGDYRIGNLLVEESCLTGVLDWELAHLGDPHEDLAYACMTVWRFARIDRTAMGLGTLQAFFAAYEAAGGMRIERSRFNFWLVYRTCWWALGCLRMGATWRSGADRTLERAIISRRTSEQELDLLMLLEGEAPEAERERPLPAPTPIAGLQGEASNGDLAAAISEWLATVKHRMEGHDRFQLAVARNALGIISRASNEDAQVEDRTLAQALLSGETTLAQPGLLARLRRNALDKLSIDMPKYPALAQARQQWTGEA
ncbi:MAG: phosphotransferase [Sphingomonadaceae bacterium]